MVQKKTKRKYSVILCVAVAIIGAVVFLVNCRGEIRSVFAIDRCANHKVCRFHCKE